MWITLLALVFYIYYFLHCRVGYLTDYFVGYNNYVHAIKIIVLLDKCQELKYVKVSWFRKFYHQYNKQCGKWVLQPLSKIDNYAFHSAATWTSAWWPLEVSTQFCGALSSLVTFHYIRRRQATSPYIDKDACLQIISPWTVPPVTAFNNKEKVLAGTFSKCCFPQNVNTFTGRCTAECMASLMSAENTFVQLGERMKMKKFASVAAYEKTE